MLDSQRIVTELPLKVLWDPGGILPLQRTRAVGSDEIREALRQGPVQFVAARCGSPLVWVPAADSHRFWKAEAKDKLIEPAALEQGIALDDVAGDSFYVASQWSDGAAAVVLLEQYH